jgi:P27 family predicted phage terminase small subunit
MGRRGRHPDPKSKRSQAAMARAQQLAKYGPAPAGEARTPVDLEVPANVAKSPPALAFWKRNAPLLQAEGRLHPEQVHAFAILCRIHADVVQLEDQVDAQGWITATDKGQSSSPVAKLLRDSRRDFVTVAKEFGMTAASAARIPQDPTGGQEEGGEVDEEENVLRKLTLRRG